MSEEFSALEPHLQLIVGLLIFVFCGCWMVTKFFNPMIDKVKPKHPAPSNELDVAVVSAAFADGKAIRELNAHIERMNDCSERMCLALDAQSRASFAVAEGARQKIESDHRLSSEIKMLTEALNRYGNRTNEPA